GFAFGTSVAQVRAASPSEHRVSSQSVFEYLYFHVIPGPRTMFEGIVRLQPGEYALFKDGLVKQDFHWTPRFVESESAPLQELERQFIDAIEQGVRESMTGASGRVGAFLSGGTDSSTIAGLATRVSGSPIDTYSIGFNAAGYDEMEYARIASRHFGTRHHEYYVTPSDVVNAIGPIARIHAQPFGNASAVPTFYCARMARADGIAKMLAGDGGDELFGGNARYAKQYLFALYERVPRALRALLIEPICNALAHGPRLPGICKGVSYVQQAMQPMPARMESYNGLVRLGLDTVLTHSMRAAIDPDGPLEAISRWYFNPTAHTQINRMLATDFKFTLADSDLPKVTTSCRLVGMPVAYPMLDDVVVDFSLRLHPDLKLKRTALRWFFKHALRDFLPEAILRKSKHGFGLPFGEWALSHAPLRDLAFDSLNGLKQRDFVRAEFIDQLRTQRLIEHPGYYGPLVWVLMMLEQWFVHHASRSSIDWRPLAS
ncbi:MAG TPA: asparagine synthase C-terminal domain-containing protein, partial [Burkholderiaceae bacterium]|nr:asparagine synthase C-terminal domain-containing protein [Burkholderiaceae bacterium]